MNNSTHQTWLLTEKKRESETTVDIFILLRYLQLPLLKELYELRRRYNMQLC